MRIRNIMLAAVSMLALSACTSVEQGHVGVRYWPNGSVSSEEYPPGWYQNIWGSVKVFVANEITNELSNLQPQTKDKSVLSDLDLAYTYSVSPQSIADLVVKYKGRDIEIHGEYYPLGAYVNNVVTTAVVDVISRYNSLQVQENRENIRKEILDAVNAIFAEEKLNEYIHVHQIFVKNLLLDKRIQDSAIRVITSQNELEAKRTEVQTAEQEALRLSALSRNAANIDYMQAKAQQDIAQAILDGTVNTIVVPWDFKGIIDARSGK